MNVQDLLQSYAQKFQHKTFEEREESTDVLMDVFGIDPAVKRQNMQYWSRELGMCWQSLVQNAAKNHLAYGPPIRWGKDEPCDLVIGKTAIDTKYRIGSGDAGTLKKLKSYGLALQKNGYTPVMLILREDNLPHALEACLAGGWKLYIGHDAFKFIERRTAVDLYKTLDAEKHNFACKAMEGTPSDDESNAHVDENTENNDTETLTCHSLQ